MYKVKALTDLVEDVSSNDEQSEAVKKISKKEKRCWVPNKLD